MAFTLADHAALIRGKREKIGVRLVPHTERKWVYDDYDHGWEWVYEPIGTCPECVEAAMVGATHVVPQDIYSGSSTPLVQSLLEHSYLMGRIPWENVSRLAEVMWSENGGKTEEGGELGEDEGRPAP